MTDSDTSLRCCVCHICTKWAVANTLKKCMSCGRHMHAACAAMPTLGHEFFCRNCTTTVNSSFDWSSCLRRLHSALRVGLELFHKVCAREDALIRHFDFEKKDITHHFECQPCSEDIDAFSLNLLLSSNMKSFLPIKTTADGNCLFHAVSKAVFGDESKSLELRVKTVIEISNHHLFYDRLINAEKITAIDDGHLRGTLNDASSVFFRCSIEGNHVGIPEAMALSSVIGMPIQFIWPSVIKPAEAGLAGDPRLLFLPRVSSDDKETIHIMVTTTHSPLKGNTWNMNHFCAISRKVPSKINRNVDLDESEDEFQYDTPKRKKMKAAANPLVSKARTLKARNDIEGNKENQNPRYPSESDDFSHSRRHHELVDFANTSEELEEILVTKASCDEMEKSETRSLAYNSWLSSKEVLRYTEQKVSAMRVPMKPVENCVHTLNCEGKAVLLEDDWNWRTEKTKVIHVDKNGSVLHTDGKKFFQKKRTGRHYSDIEIAEASSVFNISHTTFRNILHPTFKKRVSHTSVVQPEESDRPIVVQYMWFGQPTIDESKPDENHKGTGKAPVKIFNPTKKADISEAKALLKRGVPAKVVYEKVKGLRNMRQVHNLNRHIKGSGGHFTDPWGTVLKLYGRESKAMDTFVQGISGARGQLSTWLWFTNQLESFQSQVGYGNPASLDTTFGNCAYTTFFTFSHLKLVDKETGTHPTFIGPVMVHSKEHDSNAIYHWLLEIKEVAPQLDPTFCTDQDSVFLKRLPEVWPDAILVLGREHLLMNLKDQARKLKVPLQEYEILKADVFGPQDKRRSLLSSIDCQEFEDLLAIYETEWMRLGEGACRLATWIKDRKDVYMRYASSWALAVAGVSAAWQQRQERMNRTLKGMRQKFIRRAPMDLINEVKSLVLLQARYESDALVGDGPYRLAPAYNDFSTKKSTWEKLSSEQKGAIQQAFRKAQAREDLPPFRPIRDRRGLKKNTRLGRRRKKVSFTQAADKVFYI